MGLSLALAVFCSIFMRANAEAVSKLVPLESESGANSKLRGILQNNIQDHDEPGEVPPTEYHSVVPVPPAPGYNAALPHKVWLQYQDHHREEEDLLLSSSSSSLPLRLRHSPTGTFPNLVVLVRFADHADRELPSRDDISRLYNSEEFDLDDQRKLAESDDPIIPTGSVRQVYFENSHSTFTVETTVVDWITLPHTEAHYAAGEYGLPKSKFKTALVDALTALDGTGFDFGSFDLDEDGTLDGFGVLHSGYGAEFDGADCHGAANEDRIWSHKGRFAWTSSDGGTRARHYYVSTALRGKCNSRIVRMGVLCHELGHYLGLPDLYDSTFKGQGLGTYDFMSQSWGWDGTGLYPSNLSAWSKATLGWAEVDVIVADGTYQLETGTSERIRVYKISANFPSDDEYLLLENRQPVAYDSKMGEGGIAIYHVDESVRHQRFCGFPSQDGWPENGNHYKVALIPANGEYDLEEGVDDGDVGDLWHAGSGLKELGPGPDTFPNTDYYQNGEVGSTGIRIYGFSASGNTMAFSVEGLTSLHSIPAVRGSAKLPLVPTLSPTVEDIVPARGGAHRPPTGQSISLARN